MAETIGMFIVSAIMIAAVCYGIFTHDMDS